MSATVETIITRAYGEIGVLGPGEPLSAALASVGLFHFQNELDGWQADRLDLAVQSRVTFTLLSGTSDVTIGTGGSVTTTPVTTTAPMFLDTVAYVIPASSPAVEVPIGRMDRDTYASISIKALGSALPLQSFYQRATDDALGHLFLWPQVTQNVTMVLYAPKGIGVPTALSDVMTGPAGYADGFLYSLAVRLCPATGTSVPDALPGMLAKAMQRMQRPNVIPATINVDPAITIGRGAGYNILTDVSQTSR